VEGEVRIITLTRECR